MNYKGLIEHLKECSTYGFKQDECRAAATAITELLSRAEAAEAKFKSLDEARERANAVATQMEARCKILERQLEMAVADTKTLSAALMKIKRTESRNPIKVIYEMEYNAELSHASVHDIALAIFRGLMHSDLKQRGKEEE